MQTQRYVAIALAVAGLLAVAQTARAEHEKLAKQLSANDLIGMKVKDSQQEDIGKVHDVILNLDSGRAPFAIISHGGTFGTGRTKTAVPLGTLQCASDGKSLQLSATRDQLRAASKTPPGNWAVTENASWVESVDGFYGDPAVVVVNTAERRGTYGTTERQGETRQFVRDPQPKGAELLIQPADHALYERIAESLDTVQIQVDNGVTHIYGNVDS
jgi:sporulation protein YlmC with PRC-barrel domain